MKWQKLLDNDLNRQQYEYILSRAIHLLDKDWPPLPATLYMQFARDGNRSEEYDIKFSPL
jgi:hypothetical protein